MCVRVAVQFFFVKTPVPQAFSNTIKRKLFSPSPPEAAKKVSTGVEPSALLHDCFWKVHYYTIAQSFRVIVGDVFLSCFLLEKETKAVEKGWIWPFRTVAHAAPVIAGQGNRPHDRPRRLNRRQGRTWVARCVWIRHIPDNRAYNHYKEPHIHNILKSRSNLHVLLKHADYSWQGAMKYV